MAWPRISRWLRRRAAEYASRRAEDWMRRMMGMPSRKEEERAARRQRANTAPGKDAAAADGFASAFNDPRRRQRGRRYHRPARYRAADLMRAVAVDVEYTEIREFSSSTIAGDGHTFRFETEEQVTDVKYTEINI